MPNDPLWTFHGYVTAAGGQEVQDWFDELQDEAKDEVRDTLAYLEHLPQHLWRKPEYFPLGDGLSELRFKSNVLNKTIRIYGFFWPKGKRHHYTLLLGTEKTVMNPKGDIRNARKRKAEVEQGKRTIHEFEFTEDPH